ncbi:MAG TPA: PH domain-containing protein [Longimicrobium sp.]
MRHFEARLATRFKGATLAAAAVLAGLATWSVAEGSTLSAGVLLTGLLLLGLLAVRGYTVQPGELVVRRPGWSTRIDLTGLAEVAPAPRVLDGALSLLSTRGVFGVVGVVRARPLGTCRAYVTDPARTVVLRFRSRSPVVVSPRAPDAFVAALRAELPAVPITPGTLAERARPPPGARRPRPFAGHTGPFTCGATSGRRRIRSPKWSGGRAPCRFSGSAKSSSV